MDELNNKGYDSENGTPYENAGNSRLEKGYDSEKGQPYEQNGSYPYGGGNNFSNSDMNVNNTDQNYPNYGSQGNDYGYPQNNYYQQNNNYPQDNIFPPNSTFPPNDRDVRGYYSTPENGCYPYATAVQPRKKSSVLAIVSFIVALINFLLFRSVLSFLTVPFCIIVGIVCLVGKFGGKGFAIASIIVSVISGFIFCSAIAVFVRLYPDLKYFVENDQQIISEYEENGTIPERYKKYDSPRMRRYWKAMGCDDFDEFFGMLIEMYKDQAYSGKIPEKPKQSQKEDYPITA